MTSMRASKATRPGRCTTRLACENCRAKRAKCNGEQPCGRCRARSLDDCHFTNRTWTPKRKLKDEISSKKEKLHRRNYLLDALCATAGSGEDYALRILQFGGLSYDEAYEKVQAGGDAYTMMIDETTRTAAATTATGPPAPIAPAPAAVPTPTPTTPTTGLDSQDSFGSGDYETNWSSPTLDSPFSTPGQSVFSSSNNSCTDDFVCQSQSSINPDHPKLDLLQQQMELTQSIPWGGSAQEVASAVTSSTVQTGHHQSCTSGWEEAALKPSHPMETKGPEKAVSKAQELTEAAVCAGLDQDAAHRDLHRRKAKERSRAATNKCRTRKRNETSKLAWREQTMSSRNRELARRSRALQAELFTLKAHLLQHTDCNCVLIQKYIANGVEKPLSSLASGLPALLPLSAQAMRSNPAASGGGRWQSLWMEGLTAGQNVTSALKLDGGQQMPATAPAYHPSTGPLAEPLVPQPAWYQMGSAGIHQPGGFMNGLLTSTEQQVW